MKKHYSKKYFASFSLQLFLLAGLTALMFNPVQAQTSFALGEIAITGYQSDTPDKISLVFLKDVEPGTTFQITDNGWLSDASGFRPGEGVETVTINSELSCGTTVLLVLQAPNDQSPEDVVLLVNGTNVGSIVQNSSNIALSTSGDQFFVYQGSTSPGSVSESNLITGIQMNGDWDTDATNSNTSAKPSNFTDGVNSISISPEIDNAVHNCNITNGTPAEIAASINTFSGGSSWTTFNNAFQPAGIPPQCLFVCEAPVCNSVVTFTAPTLDVCIEDGPIAGLGGGTPVGIPGAISFSEPFNDNGANVMIVQEADTDVQFVDYSNMTIGSTNFSIPEAPRQIAGSDATKGILIRANLDPMTTAAAGVNIIAGTTPVNFTGDYTVSFDAYMNIPNNPIPTGTTEQLLWGVGTDNMAPIEARHNRFSGTMGTWGWLNGENGTGAEDAAINEGDTELGDLGDTQPGEDVFFNNAFDMPYTPGALNNAAANSWVRVDIIVSGGTVSVRYNGVEFFNEASSSTDGFAMFGYEDPFSSVTDQPDGMWGLFDNFVVLSGPSTGEYTGIGVIDDGNGMTFTFDPAASAPMGGNVTVTYTYTDETGCSNSASDYIFVDPVCCELDVSCPLDDGGENILINNSFEQDQTHNQPGAPEWIPFGSVFALNQNEIGNAQDGNMFIKMFGGNSGVFQNHPVSPGDIVSTSVWIQNAEFDPMLPGCTGFVKIEFLDASNTFISQTESSKLDHTLPQNTWTKLDFELVAPPGAVTVRFVVIMQCSAGGVVMFDNASMTISPSPAFNLSCIDELPAGPTTVADFEALGGTINSSCNPNGILVTFSDDDDGGAGCLGEARTIVRTITISDPQTQESKNCSVIYVIVDETPPTLSEMPTDVTVECDAVPPVPEITVMDDCQMDVVEPELWINEFHYDNDGGDVGEFIEVAGSAGTDLNGYSLVLYNGANGSVYNTINLAGVIPDEGMGFGAVAFQLPTLQNGGPDGFALVDPNNVVIEFLSYEGVFSANDGPATGNSSVNVGVTENSGTPIGTSIQLIGQEGCDAPDFDWVAELPESPGLLNNGQTIDDGCESAGFNIEVVFSEEIEMGNCPGASTITRRWSAMDACGNEVVHVQTIVTEDTTPPMFAGELPQDVTVSCDIPEAPEILAADNCDFGSIEDKVWINEFHYDNAGGDEGEFIEIAGTVGFDLESYQIVLYNGSNGAAYNTTDLSGVIENSVNGLGFVVVEISGIQNGGPDGIALVSDGEVIEFISYEGSFTASNGPAAGQTSTNIGVSEPGGTPVGFSLQREGEGVSGEDFTWSGPIPETRGTINSNQSVGGYITASFEEDDQSSICEGGTIIRTWTVMDGCGNPNSYVQTITVDPAVAPVITSCPAPQTVTCPEDIVLTPEAVVADTDCDFTSETLVSGPVIDGPEACPGTTYTYTYSVIDECGRIATCDQVFTIGTNDEPTIAVVPNITVDCFESINPNPNFADVTTACGNGVDFSVAVTDPVLGSGLNCPGESYSVVYTITDACGRTASATQTFTIANDGPTMECPDNCEVLSCYDGDYNAVIEAWLLTVSASSSCSMDLTVSNDYIGLEGICVGDFTQVTFTATDVCGRSTSCESGIFIVDTDAPDIIGQPSELLVPCTGVTEDIFADWLATRGGVEAYDACYEDDISWSTNPANPMALLDCSNGPQAIVVEFIVTDGCGNSASVTGVFNTKLLPNAVNVAGLIQTEAAEAVSSVEVSAYQSSGMAAMDVSDDNGDYNFEELPYEEDTEIVPSRDGDYLNGISTYDLILLQQHILDIAPLNSPYKRIAADANRSGSISTLDLVLLRRLILHIDEELADNTSWRFVDADFVFPNAANPFETAFPEAYNLSGEEEELKDFIAVKIGDLNLDAWTNNFGQNADDRSGLEELIFEIEDQKLKAEETYEVEINAQNFNAIRGFQMTLDYDYSLISVLDIERGALVDFSEANYNLAFADEGKVPMSWHTDDSPTSNVNTSLFSILIKAKADVQLSEVLAMGSSLTKAEAYSNTDLMNVSLNFSNNGTSVVMGRFQLFQNTPNPFKEVTTIGFQLPEASEVTLEIYDVAGKLLFAQRGNFAAGFNQIDVNQADLQAGILYYHLSTATDAQSKKMIVLE